jgi:hypothetical protein
VLWQQRRPAAKSQAGFQLLPHVLLVQMPIVQSSTGMPSVV